LYYTNIVRKLNMSNRDSFGQGRKPPITEMSCGNILIVKVDAFVSCIFYV